MPETTEAVKRLGQLGSLTGAVCCQQFGTLPDAESVMKMTSLDNMNIVKDLFLVNLTSSASEEKEKKKKEEIENAIVDSFRRDKNNIKMLMEVGSGIEIWNGCDLICERNRSSSKQ